LSSLPEGATSLTVGYVLKANRGPIGECQVVTSPSDFLTKYTFSGKPSPTDDYTYFSILKCLSHTNTLYVSRAASNALYGGLVIKKETQLGSVVSVDKTAKTITLLGDVTSLVSATNSVRVKYLETLNGRYTVVSAVFSTPNTVITVTETPAVDYTYSTGTQPVLLKTLQPTPFTSILVGAISAVSVADKKFTMAGDKTDNLLVGDRFQVKNSTGNNSFYTVVSRIFTAGSTGQQGTTDVVVAEVISSSTADGNIYQNSIANPDGYTLTSEDLFLITGIDQGEYNSNIEIEIISTTELPNSLTELNVFTITVYDATTNTQLESWMVSRNKQSKATDGTNLYITDVINGKSAYIKVIDNTDVLDTELPCNTISNVALGGGYNGSDVSTEDMIAALDYFSDKTIPISILGNGSTESSDFQEAMLALAESRGDVFCFLNSRLTDESATLPTKKATNIIEYKKSTLGSTSYLGCMYANHPKVSDTFNSRKVKIGADAIAISGWLNIINTKSYPFAYAGTTDGQVTGCTTDWKIGDMSGVAALLNDASINYIAYDAKQGSYYMQSQNTLQMANSAFRNIGVILNVLDIKEKFISLFKPYLQKPITTSLRTQILNKGNDTVKLMFDQGRITGYAFQDTSSAVDLSDNTLRYLLTIAPTPYAQKIYLVMNIVNQTFDFSILQAV
jgi:hypothetical protein